MLDDSKNPPLSSTHPQSDNRISTGGYADLRGVHMGIRKLVDIC